MQRLICCLLWLGVAQAAHGLVFYISGDTNYNTTAPTGTLADSGWHLQGNWRGYAGTPIASNMFLTAKHIGGNIGESFFFQGTFYRSVASYPDPETDLVVWQICGTFPAIAPLYTGPSEVGRDAVIFGNGATRGDAVNLTNTLGVTLKGWMWGIGDGRLRWGENRITEIYNGPAGLGKLLIARFDRNGLPNEATLAQGDSGGGLFIRNGAEWQLAGIHYSIDGPFSYTASGPGFNAALFDRGGLYQANGASWQLIPNQIMIPNPAAFYSTQISSRLTWLRGIIAAHEGDIPTPTLQSALNPQGPYNPAAGAIIDPAARTIRIPASSPTQFYRLSACTPFRITTISVTNNQVLLKY